MIESGKKSIFTVILTMILTLFLAISGKAQTPLSMALELETTSMKQGDTMHVVVSLKNYDENYTENVITTMIIETSIDTDKLEVNKESIKVELDEGRGMGFSAGQMKDGNNVELQYLNVGDPLAKNTGNLYSFDITAKEDISNLLQCIQITYIAVQDGTKAVSDQLSVVSYVLADGKAVEQETVEERYTSEYGTVENKKEEVSKVIENSKDTKAVTQASSAGQNPAATDVTADGEQNTQAQSKAEEAGQESGEQGQLPAGKAEEEERTTLSDKEETKETTADKAETEQNGENGKAEKQEKKSYAVWLIAAVVLVAVAAVAFYLYRKRKVDF